MSEFRRHLKPKRAHLRRQSRWFMARPAIGRALALLVDFAKSSANVEEAFIICAKDLWYSHSWLESSKERASGERQRSVLERVPTAAEHWLTGTRVSCARTRLQWVHRRRPTSRSCATRPAHPRPPRETHTGCDGRMDGHAESRCWSNALSAYWMAPVLIYSLLMTGQICCKSFFSAMTAYFWQIFFGFFR